MTQDRLKPPDPSTHDPILEACLQDALDPLAEALSPEELEDYRKFLTVFITTHPAASRLYEQVRQRPVMVQSGEVLSDDAVADATPNEHRAANGKGSRR